MLNQSQASINSLGTAVNAMTALQQRMAEEIRKRSGKTSVPPVNEVKIEPPSIPVTPFSNQPSFLTTQPAPQKHGGPFSSILAQRRHD